MNIIIAGVNSQTTELAKELKSFHNKITMIGSAEEVRKNAIDDIDVIVGDICNPETLKGIDTRESPIFVTTTENDHVNIIACKLAKDVLNAQTTIAYINDNYLYDTKYSELIIKESFGIDYTINIASEVANKAADLIRYKNVLDYISLNGFTIIEVICDENSAITNAQIKHLKTIVDIEITVLSITREKQSILLPDGEEELYINDKLYIAFPTDKLNEVMSIFQIIEKLGEVLIIGSNKIATFLHEKISKERNVTIASYTADTHNGNTSLSCNMYNFNSIQDLSKIDFSNIDTLVTATNNDEMNVIFPCANNFGLPQTIVCLRNENYAGFARRHSNLTEIITTRLISEKLFTLLYNNKYTSLSNTDIVITDVYISEHYVCTNTDATKFDAGVRSIIIGIIRNGKPLKLTNKLKLQKNDKVLFAIKRRDIYHFLERINKINSI